MNKIGKGHHSNKLFPSLIGAGCLLGVHFLLVEIQAGRLITREYGIRLCIELLFIEEENPVNSVLLQTT